MFRGIIGFSIGIILIAAASVWHGQIRLCDRDVSAYMTLVQESANLRSKSALELSPLRQSRKGVQKDFWEVRDGKRQAITLASASSDLLLSQKKQKIEAEEHLFEIQGNSPDPIAPISHFTATQGLVDFRKHSFVAFNIEAKGPNKTNILSESMQIDRENLLLERGVQMASELDGIESFALADRAIFHLVDKKLLLESTTFKRVLFWQEGLELSAPKIYVGRAAQGIGDVRFSFDPKEKELTERFRNQIR